MEKKNNLLKSILFVFFSFCLLATGITTLNFKSTNYSIAENVSSEKIDNGSLPEYFSAKEYFGLDDDRQPVENSESLIDSNIFMYMKEGTSSTSLKLSLITNGNLSEPSNDIYNYVYYPNLADLSVFHFYSISSISLEINGKHKEINMGDYINSSGFSFTNKDSTQLEQFEMIFNDKGENSNEIKIVDDNGNVIEGVYSLSLTFALYTCTDGNTNTKEELFEDENVTINYSFYVLDKDSYILNNRPSVSYTSFDHEVPLSNLTNHSYAYFLYSNYSSEKSPNKIPYVEYDYTRYDLKISKEYQNSTYIANLLFDTDPIATTPLVEQGDNIVNLKIDTKNNLCKVYFTDVGNYDLTFSAIHVAENETGELKKYSLDGINSVMKRIMVYVYGYQANYTDHDKPSDENNIRPVGELKSYDFENGTFEKSADITSSFLCSNSSYSQKDGSTTFLISNILNYIKEQKIDPVTTNQTPIKLTANASLSTKVNSYIYSTTKVSDAYTLYQKKALNNSDLYQTTFNGSTAGTDGTYIYVIAYTFKNYYLTETTLSNTTTFYQVFYFKIVKDLPTIQIETAGSHENIASDTYVNKDVNIIDTTKNPYNKDVTIQIYAYDYVNKQYLSKYGGTQGISFDSLPINADDNSITLSESALYTVRLYFSNEITSLDINSSASKNGLFREESFTIDKNPIENILGRNVSEIINSTNYNIGSTMTNFTTNQSIVVSWDEKKSGASTYAYYRYFPIIEAQYYSSQESLLSATLDKFLNSKSDNSWLPVNNLLNMDTANNIWLPYKANSLDFDKTISTEYVLSDSGLYLFDVYDTAGNHKVEVFMVDHTTPVFAVYDGTTYSLTSSSIYVTTPSTLYWSKNKAIYIAKFNTLNYNSVTSNSVTVDDLKGYDFYLTHDKKCSTDIYKVMYDKLFSQNYITMIDCPYTPNSDIDGTSNLISGYTGLYVTIPINETSYYLDKDHPSYASQTDVYKQEISVDEELTYRVLIRDLSNTKFYTGYESSPNATLHYTNYYSAKQTIIISFDSSEFFIKYTNNLNEKEPLSSNTATEGTYKTEDNVERKTKTTYLSPTNLNKPFILSFIPTITGEDLLIQVDSVTIKYYPYIEKTETINGINYHYYQLSEDATTFNVYDFKTNGPMTETKETELRLNANNVTTEGKYIITRTYCIDNRYSYNENDFYERTYVFYVDRNEVVSNAELVSDKDADENIIGSHLESLVGGDIFVAMYDNSTNCDLVVTFPDSEYGNSNGSSLYNNGSSLPPRSILSTNMLPVSIYIPQYKYTKYVQKKEVKNENGETIGYSFSVENNKEMNQYYEDLTIPEYNLYAEIFKDGIGTNNLIALSSTNSSNPGIDNIAVDTNTGFLKFYYKDGTPLQYLSEPGNYYIKISQGQFGTEIGENAYGQSMTFGFTIQNSQPDFTVQSTTGASLNSITNTSSTKDSPSEIYYTNQPEVTLLWNAGSTYMAEIDIDNISFKTSKNQKYSANDDVWSKDPTLSSNIYVAQLNLKKLDIYQNNGYVDITMQYKNHDDKFYTKVTKRIYIDLSAPSTNVQTLVDNSIFNDLISPLTNSTLRTYYTANMEQTTDLSNTSYNISNNTGTFAYYSYMTTQDFLQTLKNSLGSDVNEIYVREFSDTNGNNTKYISEIEQETAPADFLPSNFTNLSIFTSFDVNKYYEIVEIDKAGNMAIYTVYITNYTSTESKENPENNLFTYQTNGDDKNNYYYTIEDYQLTKTYNNAINNIYSKTGFSLKNINFFGDAWAQIKLTTLNSSGMSVTKYLMLTPWDSDYAYAFVGSNYTKIKISDLLDGTTSSRYKNCFSIYNRENKKTENFYFNIRNTNLTANLTDDQSREYIKFSAPVDSSIQSTIYATTYLTSLTINAYKPDSSTEAECLYEKTNKLGYASLWTSNDKITATANGTLGTLIFEINPNLEFVANTRIVYEYEDNYGNKYKEIHIYKETLISKEITSQHDLYSYYDSTNGRLIYITKDGFQYLFNPNKYDVKVYELRDGEQSEGCEHANCEFTTNNDGISTLTATTNRTEANYNDSFVIEVRDSADETNLVKTIYFTLYNELPIKNEGQENNTKGQFKILDANGVNIIKEILNNSVDDNVGYFSEIRIIYSKTETFIPIKYSISTDKTNWTEITSGTRLKCESQEMEKYYLKIWYDETYLKNELGTPEYVFGYVPDDQIYKFNLSSLTTTFWIENTLTGSIVNKSNTIYKTSSGTQYSNHYIVNLKYSDRDYVEIKTNKEQSIEKERVETFLDSSTVTSEHWIISNTGKGADLENVPVFNTDIIITYIPPSDNFVDEFYTYNLNGIIDTTENLVNETSKNFVVSENYSAINRIELQWTKYYGIVQNEIHIKLVKDGIELNPVIYSRKNGTKEYNYLYLTYSGKYTITFYDNSGNIQKFNKGNVGQNETFSFVFLKDVPFTVTYTNQLTGELETSLPIKQAVYNGTVTLNIDKNTRTEFYSLNGYPVINVKRNGVEYTKTFNDDTTYIFNESGYYEIYFTATSNIQDIGTLRKEVYQFTILNPNEYRYSYVYNRYSNYYVEKIVKNDVDITQDLVKTLDVSTITINKQTYLTELPLSYLDEKTGSGVYVITINSNDKLFNSSSMVSSFTFKVIIQVGEAPIKISLAEGESTTSNIKINFNTANIYNEMGECDLRIIRYDDNNNSYTYYKLSITEDMTGETSTEISTSGTFYIQIISPSGNLLYSYKVVRNEPLNTAAIIAIVISAVVLLAIIIIVIKLRKRIVVK